MSCNEKCYLNEVWLDFLFSNQIWVLLSHLVVNKWFFFCREVTDQPLKKRKKMSKQIRLGNLVRGRPTVRPRLFELNFGLSQGKRKAFHFNLCSCFNTEIEPRFCQNSCLFSFFLSKYRLPLKKVPSVSARFQKAGTWWITETLVLALYSSSTFTTITQHSEREAALQKWGSGLMKRKNDYKNHLPLPLIIWFIYFFACIISGQIRIGRTNSH